VGKVLVEIDIDISDAKKMLEKISKRSKDMRPVWKYAKRELEVAFSANFLSGGNLVPGGVWAPLDPSYAAWKASRFPGAKKMFIDGSLFRSVADLSSSSINKITPLSAEFGTDVEYAKFHQYGTTKMPARKIIFEPKGFAVDLAKKAKQHVMGEK
jgi:phage gpG-like protein